MSRTGWKGISTSLTRLSNFPRSTLTYRCGLTRTGNIVTRQPLPAVDMATQRPFSAAASTELGERSDCDLRYRPFLLDEKTRSTDWISELELDTATGMAQQDLLVTSEPLRVLVLYGSLRKRSGFVPVGRGGATADADVRIQIVLEADGVRSLTHSPPPGVRCPRLRPHPLAGQE